jgi:hypothetical protein
MDTYDPLYPPDPQMWLDLDEGERLDLVSKYHESTGAEIPSIPAHAAIHVIVENQLAERISPVEAALQRLLVEGLDRHNALHAVASVLAEHLSNIMKGHSPGADPNEPYYRALEKLSVETWGAD